MMKHHNVKVPYNYKDFMSLHLVDHYTAGAVIETFELPFHRANHKLFDVLIKEAAIC